MVFGSQELPAPQATLMKLVIDGVLEQNLPWGLVAIGAAIAITIELFRIPSLPFAVGVYLPVATMTPIFLGGMLKLWLERSARDEDQAAERRDRGVLLGSGFVGGEGLLGVAIAGVAFWQGARPAGFGTDWMGPGVDGQSWWNAVIPVVCSLVCTTDSCLRLPCPHAGGALADRARYPSGLFVTFFFLTHVACNT